LTTVDTSLSLWNWIRIFAVTTSAPLHVLDSLPSTPEGRLEP